MIAMPRPRPIGLLRDVSRHGQVRWYARAVRTGPRVRLLAEYGTEAFWAQYRAAMHGAAAPKPKPTSESLAWLVGQYRKSAAFTGLARSTQRARNNILKRIETQAGADPYAGITKADILMTRDAKAATPESANIFVRTLRGMFEWAIETGKVESNPAKDVKLFAGSNDGFPIWTEDELERFEKHWAIGTRERLAYDVILYTGLRRSDAVLLGRQHVRGGAIKIRTAKNGVEVNLPVLPPLAASIDATKTEGLTFITNERSLPFTKESFGNWFRDACRAANVRKSAHGLRKVAATRAAENGATAHDLMAMFGWMTLKEAERYTRAANRKKLGMAAGAKMLAVRTST